MRDAPLELLAPAGGRESLVAAVACGADAVYLGGSALNARRNAENFDSGALPEAVSYCHVRGVKVHLALNTLVFAGELDLLRRTLGEACAAGVDAVIVQDLAVAALVRRWAPGLPLHASTQMSVHNLDGARVLERLGFRRVVLAREMSREEIAGVVEKTSLEVECFVHGALCMSVSGQCLLSSVIGGRSGNRGMCAQPCRLPFKAGNNGYALSLRDLSLVEHIPVIRELGVTAIKIEGRMKRPEYVAAAVTACRAALEGRPVDYATLEAVFSREGFTDGYFTGERGPSMFGTRQRSDVAAAPPVLKKLQGLYRAERQSVPVTMKLRVCRGSPVTLEAGDKDGHLAASRGEMPQEAVNTPLTGERAAACLEKTGGTPYLADRIHADIQEGLMVPAAGLNALRRDALEELTRLRGMAKPLAFSPTPLPRPHPRRVAGPPRLRVRLHNRAQLTRRMLGQDMELVLPVEELAQLPPARWEAARGHMLAEIPRIIFDKQELLEEKLQIIKEMGVKGVLTGNLGGVELARRWGLPVHGDWGLNVTNPLSLEKYASLGLVDMTVSWELELRSIAKLGGALPRGMVAYGYLPLMIMRSCPVQAAIGCAKCGHSFPELTDRMDNRFFVDCRWQAAELYNCVPLFLADRLEEVEGVDFLTLYFTRESPEECDRITGLYQSGGAYEGKKTRGLYFRKVL